jgi:hypothetical protein
VVDPEHLGLVENLMNRPAEAQKESMDVPNGFSKTTRDRAASPCRPRPRVRGSNAAGGTAK